jgi:seryl-tRNA synthetase
MDIKYCGRCHKTRHRTSCYKVELDGILAESNKLSKDIGEMMKNGEKSKAAILKEKTVLNKEKSKKLANF